MEVGDDDFYIDLLFYHLKLRCYVVIDLKVGRFKARVCRQDEFLLQYRGRPHEHATDHCIHRPHPLRGQENKIVAEYALRAWTGYRRVRLPAYPCPAEETRQKRATQHPADGEEASSSGLPNPLHYNKKRAKLSPPPVSSRRIWNSRRSTSAVDWAKRISSSVSNCPRCSMNSTRRSRHEREPRTRSPNGAKELAQGKECSDTALGHESQNTSSPEKGDRRRRTPKGWRRVAL